jgi:hypothetical protein
MGNILQFMATAIALGLASLYSFMYLPLEISGIAWVIFAVAAAIFIIFATMQAWDLLKDNWNKALNGF